MAPITGVVTNIPSNPNKDNEMKDHIKGLFHDMASNLKCAVKHGFGHGRRNGLPSSQKRPMAVEELIVFLEPHLLTPGVQSFSLKQALSIHCMAPTFKNTLCLVYYGWSSLAQCEC